MANKPGMATGIKRIRGKGKSTYRGTGPQSGSIRGNKSLYPGTGPNKSETIKQTRKQNQNLTGS